MIGPKQATTASATPEDWRILRALSLYRLLLVTVQLVLFHTEYLAQIFDLFSPRWFYVTCVIYAVVALLLFVPIIKRWPKATVQSHGQFAIDAIAIINLAYACGGVPSGLGMLLLTPIVGCSLLVTSRQAMVQAAFATIVVFTEEVIRQYSIGYETTPFTQTGILGLMFFATGLAGSTVASRARRSEALVQQVGTDLASLEKLNERIIEQMQTGVVVVDADGIIQMSNEAAARWIGGRPGQELPAVAPGLAEALAAWSSNQFAERQPVKPRPSAEELVPRFTRLGDRGAPVLVLLDSAEQVRDQARQMKLAALGRLSAGIAHEIRNPLSAISHAGQLLSEAPEIDDESTRLLNMIRRQTTRIDRIVNDVLGLSRSSGGMTEELALHSWLTGTIGQYRECHPEEPRILNLRDMPADLRVTFDPNHLQQVLYNLWDNSFTHGRSDERPTEISLTGGWIEGTRNPFLEIRDNGPGIPRELADRVFEPFFTTGHQGTGLGLYLARELCEYNRTRLLYIAPTQEGGESGACFRLLFSEITTA